MWVIKGDINSPVTEVASIINSSIVGTGSVVANNVEVSNVTIQLLDDNMLPIIGIVPTFSATDTGSTNTYFPCSATDSTGVSICTFKSTVAEAKILSIETPIIKAGQSVSFISGPPSPISSITASSLIVADGVSNSEVTILLKDAFANPLVNVTPLFLAGGSNNVQDDCSPTNLLGVSTCNFRSTKAESKSIGLLSPIIKAGNSVVFIADEPSDSASMINGSSPVIANGSSTSAISIQLRDANNNPIVGITPTFSATGSGNTYLGCSLTDLAGFATCSMSSIVAEAKTLSIITPIVKSGGDINFTTQVPNEAYSTFEVGLFARNDGVEQVDVKIFLKDADNVAISNYDPVIAVSGINVVSTCSRTDGDGNSSCTITSTEVGSKTVSMVTPSNFISTKITSFVSSPFIATWKTDNSNTLNKTVTLPLVTGGTYNFIVDWGDNTFSEVSSFGDGDKVHNYNTVGSYTIKMYPRALTGFSQLQHTSSSLIDLMEISQWGANRWMSMNAMFKGCINVEVVATDLPDLSIVTSLASMFEGAKNFTGNITIDSWNVSNITSLYRTFYGASKFNSPIGSWNTINVANMSSTFSFATQFNQYIGTWNTAKVSNMDSMFYGATAFNNGDPAGASTKPLLTNGNFWKTNLVGIMEDMFSSASSFNQDIYNWDTSSVTSMKRMFKNAVLFNQDLSHWNVSNLKIISGMFYGATNFNNGDDLDPLTPAAKPLGWTWPTAKLTNIDTVFYNAFNFNQDISTWDTSLVTTFYASFTLAKNFNNGCPSVTTCNSLNSWNTGNVTNMIATFSHAYEFNTDISLWNTSKVTSMYSMFENALLFNSPIGAWNVGQVTTMAYMFESASSFNQAISAWNTSNVTSMRGMFYLAASFNNDGFPMPMNFLKWNTTNVTNMMYMFAGTSFDQDISTWDTTNTVCFSSFDTNTPVGWNVTEKPTWSNPLSNCKYAYVTLSTFNGNLGGRTGADAKCQADARHPGNGTFKAVLGSIDRYVLPTPLNWVIPAIRTRYSGSSYITDANTDDQTLVTPISSPFDSTATEFWTGLSDDWTNSGDNCLDWTSSSDTANGSVSATNNWSHSKVPCDSLLPILCVEQ